MKPAILSHTSLAKLWLASLTQLRCNSSANSKARERFKEKTWCTISQALYYFRNSCWQLRCPYIPQQSLYVYWLSEEGRGKDGGNGSAQQPSGEGKLSGTQVLPVCKHLFPFGNPKRTRAMPAPCSRILLLSRLARLSHISTAECINCDYIVTVPCCPTIS